MTRNIASCFAVQLTSLEFLPLCVLKIYRNAFFVVLAMDDTLEDVVDQKWMNEVKTQTLISSHHWCVRRPWKCFNYVLWNLPLLRGRKAREFAFHLVIDVVSISKWVMWGSVSTDLHLIQLITTWKNLHVVIKGRNLCYNPQSRSTRLPVLTILINKIPLCKIIILLLTC